MRRKKSPATATTMAYLKSPSSGPETVPAETLEASTDLETGLSSETQLVGGGGGRFQKLPEDLAALLGPGQSF